MNTTHNMTYEVSMLYEKSLDIISITQSDSLKNLIIHKRLFNRVYNYIVRVKGYQSFRFNYFKS